MTPAHSAVRLGFVLATVLVAILARGLVTGPPDLEDLSEVKAIAGVDLGPESEWYASGMNGDGATFAVMAADPLGRGPGRLLKVPSLRYSRFAYAWLATGLALGRDELVLFGLSLVGLLSVGGVAWVAFGLRDRMGASAWLLVANPALFISFVGDTAESLGILLLTIGLVGGAGLIAGLGLSVVRPSYLLGLGFNPGVAVSGLLIAVISKSLWAAHFGDGVLSGSFNLSLPLAGFLESPSVVGWLVVGAGAFTLARGATRRDISWVVSGMLVLSLSSVVYDTPINAVRAGGLLPVLWAFGTHRSRLTPVLASGLKSGSGKEWQV